MRAREIPVHARMCSDAALSIRGRQAGAMCSFRKYKFADPTCRARTIVREQSDVIRFAGERPATARVAENRK
jgi:hypothetical protein